MTGDLLRMVPGADFPGVAPGQSVEIEYLTPLLTNISFAPAGPYVVFDEAPDRGHAIDYVAVPFERPSQPGRDPRVVTPQAQYALDQAVRDIPLEALPPVFPTPLSLQKREGQLRLEAMPAVSAPPELQAEAAFAAEYLRPYVAKAGREGGGRRPCGSRPAPSRARPRPRPTSSSSTRSRASACAAPRPPASSTACSPCGACCRRPRPRRRAATLPAMTIVDAPRFGYRGLMLDVARNFQPKASVLRTLDLMARYKLNVLHFHLTDDEGWRVEIPSLPELTAVGARRGHTLDSSRFLPPAYGSGPDAGPALRERLLLPGRLRGDPAGTPRRGTSR